MMNNHDAAKVMMKSAYKSMMKKPDEKSCKRMKANEREYDERVKGHDESA